MIYKKYHRILLVTLVIFLITHQALYSQNISSKTDAELNNKACFSLNIEWGEAYNHPTFAIWIEDVQGNFIKNLFVTEAIGRGVWPYSIKEPGQWKKGPGSQPRPMTLPYWLHRRNNEDSGPKIPSPEEPIPDAITAATPKDNFHFKSQIPSELPDTFRLMLEINQPWDWNQYWSSDKYTENEKYMISCQPAVVYSVRIDLTNKIDTYYLNPIGHSHFAGEDGHFYTNLSTLTSALNIIKTAKIKVKR